MGMTSTTTEAITGELGDRDNLADDKGHVLAMLPQI